MLESENTIDRTAVEQATLINSHAVSPFREPVEIRVSANYQAVDSSVDAAINQVTRRLRRVQHELKDPVHSPFNVKIVSRHRSSANLVTLIHSWLVGEFRLTYTTKWTAIETKLGLWTKVQKAAHDSSARDSRIQGSRAELN
jgi:hypothetical protein